MDSLELIVGYGEQDFYPYERYVDIKVSLLFIVTPSWENARIQRKSYIFSTYADLKNFS